MKPGFGFDFPYESKRAPVLARNVVATSQPLATQAGIAVLARGGNAVDAALAAAITLTVVEPCNNGIGSDAFAFIWHDRQLHGLNGSGRSPQAWTPAHFRKYLEMPTFGWDTVTVPGAVRAWSSISERFGRLPFAMLFEDAIRYAKDGFHVGHITARLWQFAYGRYRWFKPFAQHFFAPGRAANAGELIRRPELAKTLELIASTNGEAFYAGALADRIVAQSEREWGCLTHHDLAEHESVWVEPTSQNYGDVLVHETPPNGQGLAALIALGLLNHMPSKGYELNSVDWVHAQVEAMKIAIRAAFMHIADPSSMQTTVEELLDPDSLRRASQQISSKATPLPPTDLPSSSDTVYLTAADADGTMVSMIQSNYMGFGSGIVIEGTGIAMQNRGAGFVLTPGHPNEVDGGKRPFHTIIPGFVTRNGAAAMSFGVMGGHMQHQGHVQMVTRVFDHGENPQAASDAPRWFVTPDFSVVLERGYDGKVAQALSDRGHRVTLSEGSDFAGGAQLIVPLDEGYCAASDHRKEGAAAGF